MLMVMSMIVPVIVVMIVRHSARLAPNAVWVKTRPWPRARPSCMPLGNQKRAKGAFP